jgi:hypothetical protein
MKYVNTIFQRIFVILQVEPMWFQINAMWQHSVEICTYELHHKIPLRTFRPQRPSSELHLKHSFCRKYNEVECNKATQDGYPCLWIPPCNSLENTEPMPFDKILTGTEFLWKMQFKLKKMWQCGMDIVTYRPDHETCRLIVRRMHPIILSAALNFHRKHP